MNKFIYNPVFLFYCGLVVYVLLAPVDVDFELRVIAIFYLLLLFFVFFLSSFISTRSESLKVEGFDINFRLLIFLVSLQYLAVFYSGYFYTGIKPLDMIGNVLAGVSNYSLYQEYFKSAEISTFTIYKVFPILSIFYFKLISLYVCYIATFHVYKFKLMVLVVLSLVPLVIYGLYRGTSFEFFEILVMFLCVVYLRSRFYLNFKIPVFKVVLLISTLLFVYSYQVSVRYLHDYRPDCLNEFCYDSDSFLFNYFPVMYKLSAYFYFGPDYMARWLLHFSESGEVFSLMLPFYGFFSGFEPKHLCQYGLSCGPTWAPDFEIATYHFGIILVFILVGLISYFQMRFLSAKRYAFVSFLGFYLLTLQLFAFPVGNFLMVSSANKLLLLLLLFLLVCKKFKRVV